MRCKICGSELTENEEAARFCKRCGSKIEIEENENEDEIAVNYYHVNVAHSNGNNKDNKKERKIKKVFMPPHLIAVLFLVLIFSSVGIFFAVRHNPEDDMIKINTLVEPLVEANYIGNFSEGLAVISKGFGRNPKYGYIDMTGEIVIPCEYAYANDFKEGLACVYKNNKWGFIDKAGGEVIPCEYDSAYPFQNGLACVCMNNRWGYINAAGEIVIPFEYERAYSFVNGLAIVSKNGKAGLIDMEGNVVVPFEYEAIYYANADFFHVSKNSKQGLMDISGNLIIPCIYDLINFNYLDGLIYAQQNGKWGILEIEGYVPDLNINQWQGAYGIYYN